MNQRGGGVGDQKILKIVCCTQLVTLQLLLLTVDFIADQSKQYKYLYANK